MDLALQRRRLVVTLAINGVCAFAAVAGAIGGLAFHVGWMNWLFGAALLIGFGAQGWLILGFMRERSQP